MAISAKKAAITENLCFLTTSVKKRDKYLGRYEEENYNKQNDLRNASSFVSGFFRVL